MNNDNLRPHPLAFLGEKEFTFPKTETFPECLQVRVQALLSFLAHFTERDIRENRQPKASFLFKLLLLNGPFLVRIFIKQ